MEELKKTYGEAIKDLEALYIPRPPKPDHDTLMKMKEGMSLKDAAATDEGAAPEPAPKSWKLPSMLVNQEKKDLREVNSILHSWRKRTPRSQSSGCTPYTTTKAGRGFPTP